MSRAMLSIRDETVAETVGHSPFHTTLSKHSLSTLTLAFVNLPSAAASFRGRRREEPSVSLRRLSVRRDETPRSRDRAIGIVPGHTHRSVQALLNAGNTGTQRWGAERGGPAFMLFMAAMQVCQTFQCNTCFNSQSSERVLTAVSWSGTPQVRMAVWGTPPKKMAWNHRLCKMSSCFRGCLAGASAAGWCMSHPRSAIQ